MFQIEQLEKPLMCEIYFNKAMGAKVKKILKIIRESEVKALDIFLSRNSKSNIIAVKQILRTLKGLNIAITTNNVQSKKMVKIRKEHNPTIRWVIDKKTLGNLKEICCSVKDKEKIIPLLDLKLFYANPSTIKTLKLGGLRTINIFSNPLNKTTRKTYKKMLKRLAKESKKQKINLISDLPLMAIINKKLSGVCPAGNLSFCIDSQAKISLCRYSSKKFFFRENFDKIWACMGRITSVCKECTMCSLFEQCGGGCILRRTTKSKDKKCWIRTSKIAPNQFKK